MSRFADLKTLLAKATPLRSGDLLAGIAATSAAESVAARMALADVPLKRFLNEVLIPYETDEVTRLIIDRHDAAAFAPVSHLTVGELREWLLSERATTATLAKLAPGLTPEMVAAVAKLMRNQDLILAARKVEVVTRFRDTIGLKGRMAVRIQPNHPTDDPKGIAASVIDGLCFGCGDAVIGVNPASDNVGTIIDLLRMLDRLISRLQIPTQSCVLTHVTTSIEAIERGAPLDLVFQSIGGSESLNTSFGISLAMLKEGRDAALSLKRGTVGDNVMYFETGQGAGLSADAHHGIDQQTLEARAYAVAREFSPLLVNTVVGFIGPEYLYSGKEIIRAGLEDHFCGKLLGLPMGVDVCYTNHAEADQDDMDTLLTLLGAAGVNFVMGVPGADDIMLNYQSTSFHDSLYVREALGLRRAPEFEEWLERLGVLNGPTQPLLEHVADITSWTDSEAWALLKTYTEARIGLGRSGASLPTREVLKFSMAHAQARDAVRTPIEWQRIERGLQGLGLATLRVASAAADRDTYLRRPDLGRQLNPESRQALIGLASAAPELLLIIGDGLSSTAVVANAVATVAALLPHIRDSGWGLAPVLLATQARVALGDEAGELLGVRATLMLIGERPGLSSPDSLGAYLIWEPRTGRKDGERNCVSNIRVGGLSADEAAFKIAWLLREAFRRRVTGVKLKDESRYLVGAPATTAVVSSS